MKKLLVYTLAFAVGIVALVVIPELFIVAATAVLLLMTVAVMALVAYAGGDHDHRSWPD